MKHTGKARPMTQITGVRKLKHTNSFTGQVPKFGVETPHKEELGKVNNNFVCSILTGTTLLTQVQVYLYNCTLLAHLSSTLHKTHLKKLNQNTYCG